MFACTPDHFRPLTMNPASAEAVYKSNRSMSGDAVARSNRKDVSWRPRLMRFNALTDLTSATTTPNQPFKQNYQPKMNSDNTNLVKAKTQDETQHCSAFSKVPKAQATIQFESLPENVELELGNRLSSNNAPLFVYDEADVQDCSTSGYQQKCNAEINEEKTG